MIVRGWPLFALLVAGCVDLTPPAFVSGQHPDATPDEGDGGLSGDAAVPDAGNPPADAGSGGARDLSGPDGRDLAAAVDASRSDAGSESKADTASIPDGASPTGPDAAMAMPPDAAMAVPPDGAGCTGAACGAPAVIDDFEDGSFTPNVLASPVTQDNMSCAVAGGELTCTWAGHGTYQGLIETLKGWCQYDGTAYTRLRFKLRASAPGKSVKVYAGVSRNGCVVQKPMTLIATLTVDTTMTSYDVDISALPRDGLILFEFDPAALDDTQYVWDDLQLVP